jgi:hypothetical protein
MIREKYRLRNKWIWNNFGHPATVTVQHSSWRQRENMRHLSAILLVASIGFALVNGRSQLALAEPLTWHKSLEPDGHTWPDGHTCAHVVATSDGFLAVRAKPGAGYTLVGKLKPGSFLDVDPCHSDSCSANSWREIGWNDPQSDSNGDHSLRGWVNAKYLRQVACLDEP